MGKFAQHFLKESTTQEQYDPNAKRKPEDLEALKQKAKEASKGGYVQHVNKRKDGSHEISDWHGGEDNVASYENGRGIGKSLGENTEVNEDKTTFHDYQAIPHHKIRITGDHKEKAKNLADGGKHSTATHLVTTYSHAGDTGTSHWADSHREGNVVHLRDHYTGKHIATMAHSDLHKD